MDASQPDVPLVMLAEFDLGEGSTISEHYPNGMLEMLGFPTTGGSLADLMLPEGTQTRIWDNSIFLINRSVQAAEESSGLREGPTVKGHREQLVRSATNGKREKDCRPGDYVVYKDSHTGGVERVGIFPPQSPSRTRRHGVSMTGRTATIADSIFKTDDDGHLQQPHPLFSRRVSKEHLWGPSSNSGGVNLSVISEKNERSDHFDNGEIGELELVGEEDVLFCYTIIHTKKEKDAIRGARIKALSLCCKHQFFQIYEPLMWETLLQFFASPSRNLIVEFYKNLNSIKLSHFHSMRKKYKQYWINNNTKDIKYSFSAQVRGQPLPVCIPINYLHDEVYEANISLLVHTFKEKVMVIFNAILLEKRVMFMGHNIPSWTICKCVLSACILVSPIEGLLRERAYPYANFGCFDFLDSPGYIVGVASPFLKDKGKKYWDVFCDISTGEVIINNDKNLSLVSATFSSPTKLSPSSPTSTFSSSPTFSSSGSFSPSLSLFTKGINEIKKSTNTKFHPTAESTHISRKYTVSVLTSAMMDERGVKHDNHRTSLGKIQKSLRTEVRKTLSYRKWKEQYFHIVEPGNYYTETSKKLSQKIWEINRQIRIVKDEFEKFGNEALENSKEALEMLVSQILAAASSEDLIMEIFTLLSHHRFRIEEKLAQLRHYFPGELHHRFLMLWSEYKTITRQSLYPPFMHWNTNTADHANANSVTHGTRGLLVPEIATDPKNLIDANPIISSTISLPLNLLDPLTHAEPKSRATVTNHVDGSLVIPTSSNTAQPSKGRHSLVVGELLYPESVGVEKRARSKTENVPSKEVKNDIISPSSGYSGGNLL